MKSEQKYVLDTTVFTSVETIQKRQDRYIANLVKYMRKVHARTGTEFYIPYPTVYDELRLIMEGKDRAKLMKDVGTWVVKKTPDRYNIKLSAGVFFEYITEIRTHIDRGLRVAEQALKKYENGKGDIGEAVNDLRDNYKSAVRQGILDSTEDLDMLLLAKEIDGTIVTTDSGLKRWAEVMGLKIIDARDLLTILKETVKVMK